MEVLSRLLKKTEECNLNWSFHVGAVNFVGMCISHLLFADDTILSVILFGVFMWEL